MESARQSLAIPELLISTPCSHSILDVNLQQSCGAAIRVKPRARLCEGNHILEESTIFCHRFPIAPKARHSIATAVRPWFEFEDRIKARRADRSRATILAGIAYGWRPHAAPSALDYQVSTFHGLTAVAIP
jgi:hypothetical protein